MNAAFRTAEGKKEEKRWPLASCSVSDDASDTFLLPNDKRLWMQPRLWMHDQEPKADRKIKEPWPGDPQKGKLQSHQKLQKTTWLKPNQKMQKAT